MKSNENNVVNVKFLLKQKGIDINARDNLETALFKVVWNCNIEIVKLLLKQKGIDVNIINSRGISALMIASIRGCTKIVKLLLEHEGIDLNAKDSEISLVIMKEISKI